MIAKNTTAFYNVLFSSIINLNLIKIYKNKIKASNKALLKQKIII